jgi:hypothetical protein
MCVRFPSYSSICVVLGLWDVLKHGTVPNDWLYLTETLYLLQKANTKIHKLYKNPSATEPWDTQYMFLFFSQK